jgi:hypothetical protein
MGMSAEIIAIGSFNNDIVKHLEYPEQMYSKTLDGSPVVEIPFGITEGSTLSRELASLLGITDPWDFNQHKLDPDRFDKEGLEKFVQVYEEYSEDLEALHAFVAAHFDFYFCPNG